jgi:hypothetical protein
MNDNSLTNFKAIKNIENMLKKQSKDNKYSYKTLVNSFFHKSLNRQRTKRDTSTETENQNLISLFIDYLVVIDKSTYNVFLNTYGNMPDSLITNYINIFFAHLINGVMLYLFYFL